MLSTVSEWTRRQWQRLLKLEAAPHAIAGGGAIGVIVGFSPLFSIKTLLALLLAWLCRSSKLAAVIVVTLHDLILPLEPFLLRWQYNLGYWLLSVPHQWPAPLKTTDFFLSWRELLQPQVLAGIIWPTLVGSLVMSIPLSALAYWFLYRLVQPTGRDGEPPATKAPQSEPS